MHTISNTYIPIKTIRLENHPQRKSATCKNAIYRFENISKEILIMYSPRGFVSWYSCVEIRCQGCLLFSIAVDRLPIDEVNIDADKYDAVNINVQPIDQSMLTRALCQKYIQKLIIIVCTKRSAWFYKLLTIKFLENSREQYLKTNSPRNRNILVTSLNAYFSLKNLDTHTIQSLNETRNIIAACHS